MFFCEQGQEKENGGKYLNDVVVNGKALPFVTSEQIAADRLLELKAIGKGGG